MADDDALRRIDSFPYLHRAADIMVAPVTTAQADDTLEATVRRLQERRHGSCLVIDRDGKAVGIVTERDIVYALGRLGREALGLRLDALMSTPVEWIAADALLYRAIARMDRRRIRHLPVLDGDGRPLGMVTARGVLRVRAGRSLAIGDAVETAADAAALRAAHDELPALASSLLAEGIDIADICAVVSGITRDITARAAHLAGEEMMAAGEGTAPAAWCLLVLGSAGRGESLLAPDQDNALIVADAGLPAIDGWFARWGERLNALLDAAGIPLCKGGVMVRNRAFRRTVAEWRLEIARWLSLPVGEALLNVDIFFDGVPVAGDHALAREVYGWARAETAKAPGFLRQLAEAGTTHRPPLGLFGTLKLENGRADLKRGGLLPIVSAARVMALKTAADVTGTAERLAAAAAAGRLGADNADGLIQARRTIAEAILRQQIEDLRHGQPPGNAVDPRRLNRRQRTQLKDSLRQAGDCATLVQDALSS